MTEIRVYGTPDQRTARSGNGQFLRKHGLATANHPAYVAWKSIRRRCLDPEKWDFYRYGGRGIKLFDPWVQSPVGFVAYVDRALGPRPDPSFSIDRKDNDGNYEPGNLRWASRVEQQNNKSTNRLITHNGRTQTLQQWGNELGIKPHTLRARIVSGMAVSKALSPRDFRCK